MSDRPKIFAKEREMQTWFELRLADCDGILDIILDVECLDNLTPTSDLQRDITASYRACWESLAITEPISFDENISHPSGGIFRPDAVLFAPETQAIVLVELKNASAQTREAGTELGAYAAAVRAYLPSLSEADTVHVLISSEWPPLLRQYVVNEILWGRRNVLCLRPVMANTDVHLEIVPPNAFDHESALLTVSAKHLGGFHLSLEDYSSQELDRQDRYLPNMKAAMHAMAAKGYSLRGHGFCLLSSSKSPMAVAPHAITVVNVAPFRALERLLKTEIRNTRMFQRLAEVVREHDPTGHTQALFQIVGASTPFFREWCTPRPEDFTDWANLREPINRSGKLVYFQGWGLFGDKYFEALAAAGSEPSIDPDAISASIGAQVINELIDDRYEFIDLVHSCFPDDPEEDEDLASADPDDPGAPF